MGVRQQFADTRKVQGRNTESTVTITIPAPIADELEIEQGDEILWQCVEGDESAEIKRLKTE